jgi:FkbM family methyltransferase
MLLRKASSALRIFRDSGMAGVRQAFSRNVWGTAGEAIDEVEIVRAAFKAAGSGQTMVDVGAHFGGTALPFCQDGWRVIAFEPDSENRKKLFEALKSFPRAVIDVRALSNTEKDAVTFYRSSVSTGISGLSAFDASHVAAGDAVPMTTLSRALAEHGVEAIDFLKIDTEGYDKFVLEGLPWERMRPTVIICEFEDHKTKPLGYGFDDLAGYLAGKGYTVIVSEWMPIVRYGVEHTWNRFHRFPCALSSPLGWGNLIAVRDAAIENEVSNQCRLAEHAYRRRHGTVRQ